MHRATHLLSERATAAVRRRAHEGGDVPQRRRSRTRSSSRRARPTASTWSRRATAGSVLKAGDEILLSWLEHHSNIVPWQLVCGADRRDDQGRADQRCAASSTSTRTRALLSPRTKIVAVGHVSNALGTINPIKRDDRAGARASARWCWSTARRRRRTCRSTCRTLDCDFYVLSSHKMFGPTGTGVLYGRQVAARGDAAVSGRRRHDRHRSRSRRRSTTRSRTSSRRARRTSPAWSGFGAAIDYLTTIDRAGRAGARGRRARATRRRRVREIPGARIIGEARAEDRRAVVPASTACIRTTPARSSISRASPCAPASTARSR